MIQVIIKKLSNEERSNSIINKTEMIWSFSKNVKKENSSNDIIEFHVKVEK